jgi:hypothetical protein
MGIIEITYPARCKDCHYLGSYSKGKLRRSKCMYEFSKAAWSFKDVSEFDGKPTTLKDKACRNFKL